MTRKWLSAGSPSQEGDVGELRVSTSPEAAPAPAGDRRPSRRAPLRLGELIERQLLGDRVANAREIFLLPSARVGRCKIEPDFGLDPILRHAVAFVEQKAEQELSRRLALLGSLMQPTGREDIVSGNAETVLIHIAEIGLGDRRTPLRFDKEKRRRANIVMTVKGALAGAERVGFYAGGKTQSSQRQSESKTAGGANSPSAVERVSICRNHRSAPVTAARLSPETTRTRPAEATRT